MHIDLPNQATPCVASIRLSRRSLLAATLATGLLQDRGMAFAQGTPPVVLITGTSSGFGRLATETLARAGFRVIATMREMQGRNAPAANELRTIATTEDLAIDVIEIDVDSDTSVTDGVAAAVAAAGRIDILVNNAGIIVPGPVELSLDAARAQFETNVFGGLRMLRAVAPHLRAARPGLVIHISSGLGRFVFPTNGVYSATKFATEALFEAAAYELHPLGVEVAIVQPGAFTTKFKENGRRNWDALLGSLSDEDRTRAEVYAPALEVTSFGMADEETPPAQNVAETILALAQAQAGTRALRTPVMIPEQAEGLNQLNGVLEGIQSGILQGAELGDWLTLRI
jgi:NAD(P)-dependent dehydrogenase (short-subunit alcohol dehydrogenase family)